MKSISHPEEIQRLMEHHAEEARLMQLELDTTTGYWCPKCERPDAQPMPRIIAGRPARYECVGCGWWKSKDAYEAETERILGLERERPQAVSQRIKVGAGKRTMRSAVCPVHERKTYDFAGVNGSGWLFECAAPGEEHSFLADPAAEVGS